MGDWGESNQWGAGGDSGAVDGDEKPKNSTGCRKCGEEGHFAKDCTIPDKCRKCNQEGHIAKNCDLPDTCRRCGEEGHMVKDCEKPEETRMITKEDGTKAEIYIPKEVQDEELFESNITSGINFSNFDNIKVEASGDNPLNPIKSFDEGGLRQLLLENVKKSGYTKPTPIQKHAIPTIMAHRDMMACAQTGSGKTAAFLLPILHKLLEENCDPNAGNCPQTPQALIVAPTRELAIQIKDECRKFAQGSVLKAVVTYGGTSVGFQINTLMRGCNVLIATPGRLKDFVEKGKIKFTDIKYLVLDEADRMLDMGFQSVIQEIIEDSSMPQSGDRVTLMFSATFPPEVQELAANYLKNYLFIKVGMVGAANSDVKQTFFEVKKFEKREKLKDILTNSGQDKTLVFVETKKQADFLAAWLSNEGFPTTSIHGDRFQSQREEALRDFKTGKFPILVATAVAARGLDIKGVAHVVNFDLPESIDEYVHRIGRTGRVGNIGMATSFFDEENSKNVDLAQYLVPILRDSLQEIPDFLESFGEGKQASFGGSDIRGNQNTQVSNAAEEEW